jgi:hypothetical protein
MKKLIGILSLVILFTGCTRHVDDVKINANKIWQDAGFEVVGYEGYKYSLYGGDVWYIVKRDSTLYHGFINKWENEYHIYSLSAINAIKGD